MHSENILFSKQLLEIQVYCCFTLSGLGNYDHCTKRIGYVMMYIISRIPRHEFGAYNRVGHQRSPCKPSYSESIKRR